MPRLVIKPSKLLTILVKYYNFRPIRQKGSHVFLTNFEHSGLTKDEIIKYL
jgi:predicted RNA binding protein YcfA (HicA-like mRNA interferase family)